MRSSMQARARTTRIFPTFRERARPARTSEAGEEKLCSVVTNGHQGIGAMVVARLAKRGPVILQYPNTSDSAEACAIAQAVGDNVHPFCNKIINLDDAGHLVRGHAFFEGTTHRIVFNLGDHFPQSPSSEVPARSPDKESWASFWSQCVHLPQMAFAGLGLHAGILSNIAQAWLDPKYNRAFDRGPILSAIVLNDPNCTSVDLSLGRLVCIPPVIPVHNEKSAGKLVNRFFAMPYAPILHFSTLLHQELRARGIDGVTVHSVFGYFDSREDIATTVERLVSMPREEALSLSGQGIGQLPAN